MRNQPNAIAVCVGHRESGRVTMDFRIEILGISILTRSCRRRLVVTRVDVQFLHHVAGQVVRHRYFRSGPVYRQSPDQFPFGSIVQASTLPNLVGRFAWVRQINGPAPPIFDQIERREALRVALPISGEYIATLGERRFALTHLWRYGSIAAQVVFTIEPPTRPGSGFVATPCCLVTGIPLSVVYINLGVGRYIKLQWTRQRNIRNAQRAQRNYDRVGS